MVQSRYLFNPFSIAACLAQTGSLFTNCAILHAIAAAVAGNVFNTIFALAVATYLSLCPILLAPPLALLVFDRVCQLSRKQPATGMFYLKFVAGFMIALLGMFGASYLVTDSWAFLLSTYGVQLTLSDLTPNVGLWWYFFIEMFDSFRQFFLAVFWLHMSSYVVGLSIRIR